MNKHCDLCLYSYETKDRESRLPCRKLRQHCCNPHYNARPYSFPRYYEGWTTDDCRFWTPRYERREAS